MGVRIKANDDPEVELGRLSDVERKETAIFIVTATDRCGVNQVDRIAKALAVRVEPHWRLLLFIDYDDLESVPDSVWELVNLTELHLSGNKLKTISPGIAKLIKLRTLRLSANPFGVFPEAVCQLKRLKALAVEDCQLSILPSSFASLRNLLELRLDSNQFGQLPEVLCELQNLQLLQLISNELSSLPLSFANLRELMFLDVSRNRFKEFPAVVCELLNLKYLWMGGNQMSELPLAITQLVKLRSLDLHTNLFTSFPLFLGDLPQLFELGAYGSFNLSHFHLLTIWDTDNPRQGHQQGLCIHALPYYLQERRAIPRLSVIIASGFFCDQTIPWPQFLFQGVYDPRLFIIIFDFALDFEEAARKKFRAE